MQLLKKEWLGKESSFYQQICKKYGVTPSRFPSVEASARGSATRAPTSAPPRTTTLATTLGPTTTTTTAIPTFPPTFCAKATAQTEGMKAAIVTVNYNLKVHNLARINGELRHIKSVENTSSPEYSALFQELASHGICLQGLRSVTPARCVGDRCSLPPSTTITTSKIAATKTAATPNDDTLSSAPDKGASSLAPASARKPTNASKPAPTHAPSTTTTATTTATTTTTTTATTTAPRATTHAPVELPMSAPDLTIYKESKMIAFMFLYLEPHPYITQGIAWPSDADLKAQIMPVVSQVLQTFINAIITVTKASVGPLPILQHGWSASTDLLSKELNITFEANVYDADATLLRIQRWGHQLAPKIAAGFLGAQYSWLNSVSVRQYTVINYYFTSGRNAGQTLRQRTGHKHGNVKSDSGSLPVKLSVR